MRPTVVAPQMKNEPASAQEDPVAVDLAQHGDRRRSRARLDRLGQAAVGRRADLLGRVAQTGAHGHEGEDGGAADHDHRRAPVAVGDEVRHQRQEDELAGGVGRGEQADHEAAALREPAPGDGGGEDGRDRAGGRAGHEAPHDVELPELCHLGQRRPPRRR